MDLNQLREDLLAKEAAKIDRRLERTAIEMQIKAKKEERKKILEDIVELNDRLENYKRRRTTKTDDATEEAAA